MILCRYWITIIDILAGEMFLSLHIISVRERPGSFGARERGL